MTDIEEPVRTQEMAENLLMNKMNDITFQL